jgi:hypothetical protein
MAAMDVDWTGSRNGGGMKTFAEWMRAVDAALAGLCGLTSACLADQCWRDWYDAGVTPEEAARDALEEEGFPFE